VLWLLPLAAFAAPRPPSAASVDVPGLAIRCHVERAGDAWRCDDVLGTLSELYTAAWLGEEALLPPLVRDGDLGGSDALDVYLVYEDEGAGTVGAWCDGAELCLDADPGDGRFGTSAFLRADVRTDAAVLRRELAAAMIEAAWLSTDAAEAAEGFRGATTGAVAMALLGSEPPVPAMADYQALPWASSLLQGSEWLYEEHGYWTQYSTGAVFWVLWAEANAVGPAPTQTWWAAGVQDGAANEPDVLDAWDRVWFRTWEETILEVAGSRALAGTERTPNWLPQGQPSLRAWREDVVLELPADLTPSFPPYPLGMSMWDVVVDAGAPLAFDVQGHGDARWALVIIDPTGVQVPFDAQESGRDLHVEYSPGVQGLLTVVVVNLGPPGFDADDPLAPASFDLTIRPDPLDELDPPATTGTCGCSGGPGSFAMLLLPLLWRRVSPASRAASALRERRAPAPRG
jgi:hypothetical protein